MKNYDEYTDNIRNKAKNIKKRRRIAWSCTTVFVLALALTLFMPYSDQLPNVDHYQTSPYYKLIPGLNKATYQPPAHKNNYEWLKSVLSATKFDATMDGMVPMAPADLPTSTGGLVMEPIYQVNGTQNSVVTGGASAPNADQKYEEVTDNQVQGVIESDIFKRSDKYIYYLRGHRLTVYSIDKENSAAITTVELPMDSVTYSWNFEMFLSRDCTTLTVLSQQSSKELGACTVVYSLDVTDPTDIKMQEPLYFKGSFITARVVEDDLLLLYNYRVTGEIDFDKPETFVPVYGTRDELQPLPAEDIYCPAEEPTAARYTVIAKLDSKTLQVQDTAALLSYSTQVYVSQSAIYATYSCIHAEQAGENTQQTDITEITGIGYTGDTLDIMGTVTLEGSVKDQYSLDEYNGILRVATSTSTRIVKENSSQFYAWVTVLEREDNCNLYCIDLSTWEVAASVQAFAPDGEEVTSARFNGPVGYICTAEVVIMTDPVYYFDLSDIYNITYKHTPVIDGYSANLINFGDFLLGIGYNGDRDLKVEVYQETAEGVEPIASFERNAWFSENYKAYYIDREQNLVGLAVHEWVGQTQYYLLHFDGYQLVTVVQIPMNGSYMDTARADIIDGYLYLLEKQLQVVKLY